MAREVGAMTGSDQTTRDPVRSLAVDAEVFVIGAGPAGLTAAYCLSKEARSVLVIERDPAYVGGISRTVDYKGFLFDIGGHRFFSKSQGSGRAVAGDPAGRLHCPAAAVAHLLRRQDSSPTR